MSSDEENNSPYDEEDRDELDEEYEENGEEEENDDEEEEDDDDERVEDEGVEDENTNDEQEDENEPEEYNEFGQMEGRESFYQGEDETAYELPEQLVAIDRQAVGQNAGADSGQPSLPSFNNLVKGAMDGFGSGTIGDIVSQISSLNCGEGGLSNVLASGTLGALAGQLIASAAHQFLGINPDSGRIIGAIAGNLIFGLGGRDNSLSGIGKLVLDQLVSGRFQRPVQPFVSPRPDFPSFQLNFQVERERCLRERRLFEDPEFGANDQSLYFSKSPPKLVEWKRPGEIIHDPQLLVEQRASRFDVLQGQLGDCWLLAATASLTLREELFFRVVPPDQSFVENYAGIFHFQFWRYGQWVDVVIDDRLPTHNGQLLYMHSPNGQSFWSALLEKAYAKLYGSYEALKGGTTSEALEDFTGGLIEHFDLEEMNEEQILAVLVRGFQMGSFFGCSIDADPDVTEARLDNGLVMGHAYSITAIQTIQDGPNDPVVLLRIRNPWGEHEWMGPWSDGASEWNNVSEADRQRMHLSFADDGEFWMCLPDFHREFQRMECCNLGPEVLNEICEMMDLKDRQSIQRGRGIQQRQWSQFSANGEWSIARGTGGGCRNYPTFDKNPQYGTMVVSIGNSPEADGKCTLICAVLQKFRRELRAYGLDDLPIGFAVYPMKRGEENSAYKQQQQIQPNYYAMKNLGYGPGYPPISPTPSIPIKMQRLDHTMLHGIKTVAKSASFVNLREVTARFRLEPGQYVIIPSTYEPDQEAQFLLRVFCSGQFEAIEL